MGEAKRHILNDALKNLELFRADVHVQRNRRHDLPSSALLAGIPPLEQLREHCYERREAFRRQMRRVPRADAPMPMKLITKVMAEANAYFILSFLFLIPPQRRGVRFSRLSVELQFFTLARAFLWQQALNSLTVASFEGGLDFGSGHEALSIRVTRFKTSDRNPTPVVICLPCELSDDVATYRDRVLLRPECQASGEAAGPAGSFFRQVRLRRVVKLADITRA